MCVYISNANMRALQNFNISNTNTDCGTFCLIKYFMIILIIQIILSVTVDLFTQSPHIVNKTVNIFHKLYDKK